MRPEEKSIKELLKKGYSTLKTTGHKNYDECPDVWRLLEIWLGVGQRSLYLDYEWEFDKYHFYFYKNRKMSAANRPKTECPLEVYHVETYLKEKMPYFSLARKVARTISGKKGLFRTEDTEVMNAVVGDIENFARLVYWFVEGDLLIGYAFDEYNPMFIIGDYDKVFDTLKEMGYETHMDEDEEIELFDDIALEYVW